jgi:hypothetical protein
MTPHAYWRLFFGSHDGSNYNFFSLWQLDFQDASGMSLCSGGTAFASSIYGPYGPGRIFPGGANDWVSNNEMPCYVGYHFASPVLPAKIMLSPSNTGNQPVMIIAQSSDDGVTWTDEYLITKPSAWTIHAQYLMNIPLTGGAATSQHWLMWVTLQQDGSPGQAVNFSDMRFLDGAAAPYPGFTDTRGTSNSGTFDWSPVWNGGPPSTVYTASTTRNVFGQASYPSSVMVLGLSVQAQGDPFYLKLTPAGGSIWSSVDNMIWGRVWDFSDSNATGLPIAPLHKIFYQTAPPPPPTRHGVAVF